MRFSASFTLYLMFSYFLENINVAIEGLAAFLAIFGVILSKRRSVWCWLVNSISSILYGYIFFKSTLFGDALLQGVFVCLSIYGWIEWKLHATASSLVFVEQLTRSGTIWSILVTGLLAIVIRFLLMTVASSDAASLDALTTAMSLVGIWLQTRRAVENWLWWLVADVIYVALYIYKDLYITAVLYGIFIVLAWQGWQAWKATIEQQNATSTLF